MDPLDSGPIYKETLMGRFPVEPWNTASNLFFLGIVIYWSIQVYKAYQVHRFIAYTLPILFIGYIGGTIYHATRSHEVWLLMDWVPILLLTVAVGVYYAIKQRLSWFYAGVLVVIPTFFTFSLKHLFDISRNMANLVSYTLMAFAILYPMYGYLKKSDWKNGKWVLFALFSFVTAITFRSIDKLLSFELLPMGTHWLWHSFGALAAHFLITYIFRDDLQFSRELATEQ